MNNLSLSSSVQVEPIGKSNCQSQLGKEWKKIFSFSQLFASLNKKYSQSQIKLREASHTTLNGY